MPLQLLSVYEIFVSESVNHIYIITYHIYHMMINFNKHIYTHIHIHIHIYKLLYIINIRIIRRLLIAN